MSVIRGSACCLVMCCSALAQDVVRDAETAMRAKLRDPETARFEKLTVRPDPAGGQVVCGYVNAKNRFGGYAGLSQFVYLSQERLALLRDQMDVLSGPIAGEVHARQLIERLCD